MLIGELARRTGVSPRLLRYYEEQGLLETRRGPNGYRHYAPEAVETVRRIRTLLDAGLTTDVIRSLLPCVRGEGVGFNWCDEVRATLEGELTALDARIDGLRRNRTAIASYLARYEETGTGTGTG
ncbi:MerR family transcriptional regulator [Streptomyces albus subsp. chlorinus]|uniref:MerR family transcriptional regulator n=1 Tax=Streptomyces albus TaxID=1888 RepID=UPI00156FBAB7|nr:MerR family transcriptional regulator [Streptomyces albus]NSC23445.1 MerR family transcriptional regulator [Streptomyces albus subsp. chlorinus]